ncbi:helix-turn-helix domain-containing protein [Sporosarcina sp. ACRSM]|uniref:helix-turn-helix domain-containing protein n=1 Tax=Sporosarcina sp. ACRSM TaxID=2918216 RepID=UPI001EF57DCD|nr:helix-turn-helix domain-containing protein [Sporosarcina sp. ACRSM]MCG7335301.1 helix-turn-helix domain-containing protein [Sporosarcina sp. ACRSM]
MTEFESPHSLLQDHMNENELTILVDSIRSITSSLDLDEVLKKIMRNALKVIPATDAGYLLLYDEASDRLLAKAPIGFTDNIYNFKVKKGESITGKVFEDGIGRFFNSHEELMNTMDDFHISKANLQTLTTSITSTTGPETLICVPISLEGKRIGVMTTHQLKRKKVLDENDLLLLQVFAEQAAIAIQNAQYYAEAQRRIGEITQLSTQLEERNSQLQKRHEVQETLTAISLENRGIEAMIHAFNQMIDCPVTFFSNIEEKFYSNSFQELSTPDPHELKNIFASSRKPIHLEIGFPAKMVYLYPIYNGIVFLGCFILHVKESISESDHIALEQGCSILTLELIKNQTVTEFFYKKTHEQFLTLLDAPNNEHLEVLAKENGLDVSSHWFLTIFEIPNYTDLQILAIKIHHLVLKLKKKLPMTASMIYGLQNQVILLAPLDKPDQFQAIRQKFQTIKNDWDADGNPAFRAGISATYKGLQSIQKLHEEATKTLAYLASRNRSDMIRYEDIGLNRLFLNQPPEEIEQFINEVFVPLSASNESKTELEETLLAYFNANRSATKTAKKLHIHINTLYQRLRKIEHLLQLDLNDNEDSLKIQLACHLRSTYL